MKKLRPILPCFIIFLAGCLNQNTEASKNQKPQANNFKVELVTSGHGVIWGFEFLDEKRIIFTEREGFLKIIQLDTKETTSISGVPNVLHSGQGGLLDLQLHPGFESNNLVYLSYSIQTQNAATTRIARAKLNASKLVDLEVLFTADPPYKEEHHFGSRITFDKKNYLFFSVGDRGNRDFAQDLSRHNGKIIRLHDDGRVPTDNPFVNTANAKPEIWSYGHRNPQGLIYDPKTDRLWEHEHGPKGGDEINLIQKGLNYGWPIITYGREYIGLKVGEGITEKEGMEQPSEYYVPSIAPSGLEIYSGKLFNQWEGNLFIGALVLTHLNRVEIASGKATEKERLLSDLNERIRDVRESPAGYLYVSTDSGRIYKLSPL